MSLFAAALALLLSAAQPEPDAPISTAQRPPTGLAADPEAPARPAPGDPIADTLLSPPVEVVKVPSAPEATPELGPQPSSEPAPDATPDAAPGAAQATPPPGFEFDPRTKTDGETLQVVLGQRAAFRLDDKGLPVLDAVEDGRLADAHPPGEVAETFVPPGKGLLAAALDGSAEKRATVLKVWNGLDHPVELRAVALVMRGKVLTPVPVAFCPVAAGGVRTQSWPAPIVAVGLARFKTAGKTALAQPGCSKDH